MDEEKTAIGENSTSDSYPQSRQTSIEGEPHTDAEGDYRKGLKDEGVELGVEKICNKGCQAVRDHLMAIEHDEVLPELKKLTPAQRQEVYRELQSIMAVYGDICRLS